MPRSKQYKSVCKNCKRKFLGWQRKSKFCSRSCAAFYNNKHRKIGRKKQKISSEEKFKCVKLYKSGHTYQSLRKILKWGFGRIHRCLIQEGVHIRTPHKKWKDIKSKQSRRRKLILERGKKCEWCKLKKWMDKPILLDMHHINANTRNNNKKNLLLLCPNCHSLTNSYRGRKNKEIKIRRS